MIPAIQFAESEDGVPIAYAVDGEGPVLIWLDVPWFSHLQREAPPSAMDQLFASLSANVRIVRIDMRGSGASGRSDTPITIDLLAADILAVAAHVGAEKFSLFAREAAGPPAIKIAAAEPSRVDGLILYASWLRGTDPKVHPRMEALEALIDVDWEMYAVALARVVLGVDDTVAPQVAAYFRECVDADTWKRGSEAVRHFDVSDLASAVHCPVLVLYPEQGALAPIESSREMASRIPGARLVTVPGKQIPFASGRRTGSLIADFMGVDLARREPPRSTLQVLMFTDIEGHTAMMARLGDVRGRAVLREHEQRMRRAISRQGGQEIKSMGDGFMAAFGSVNRALDCARALQRAFADPAAGEPLRIRVGINAGEPIKEDNDLFGRSVITASRIAGQAAGGEVLVANVVQELAEGGTYSFSDAGIRTLRGLEATPMQLWELQLD